MIKLLNRNAYDLNFAYIDILAQFNEFIDSCNIDTTQINKSIIDQIKEHYELSNASNSEEDIDREIVSDNEKDSDNNEEDYESEENYNKENNTSNKNNIGNENDYESNDDNNEKKIKLVTK